MNRPGMKRIVVGCCLILFGFVMYAYCLSDTSLPDQTGAARMQVALWGSLGALLLAFGIRAAIRGPTRTIPAEPVLTPPKSVQEASKQTAGVAEEQAVLFILPEHISSYRDGYVPWTNFWSNLKPSDLLLRAVEGKDEATVRQAFRCCQFHFDKAYTLLQSGDYEAAHRQYVMGGCNRASDIVSLSIWEVPFEYAVALEMNNNERRVRGDIVTDSDRDKCYRRLPSSAPCSRCGVMHAKPASWRMSVGVCPRCHDHANFAKRQWRELMAAVIRRKAPAAVREFEATLRSSVLAQWGKPLGRDSFAPQVQTLISLALANQECNRPG
jgi:hypothetical protein